MLSVLSGRAWAQTSEAVIPLGPAQVRELQGEAWAASGPPATPGPATAAKPLHAGDRVTDGQKVKTGPTARLELLFADGTLLRIGPAAEVTLLPQLRRIALHHGRVLVAADRMVGGLGVLTRRTALLPEGTTYLAESSDSSDEVMVLEGVVCACTVAATTTATAAPEAAKPTTQPPAPPAPASAPRAAASPRSAAGTVSPPTRDQMVLPGEAMTLTLNSSTGADKNLKLIQMSRPRPKRLADVLRSEPLIIGFAAPLPSLRIISDQAREQSRGALTSRNERLRRELFWKRPPHAPVKLPPFFNESDTVIIRYVYPD